MQNLTINRVVWIGLILWIGVARANAGTPTPMLELKPGMKWVYQVDEVCYGSCSPDPWAHGYSPESPRRIRKAIHLATMNPDSDSTTIVGFTVRDSVYFPNRPDNPLPGFATTDSVKCLSQGNRIACPDSSHLGDIFFLTAADKDEFVNRSEPNPVGSPYGQFQEERLLAWGPDTIYFLDQSRRDIRSGSGNKVYFKQGIGLVHREFSYSNPLGAQRHAIDLISHQDTTFNQAKFLYTFIDAYRYAVGIRSRNPSHKAARAHSTSRTHSPFVSFGEKKFLLDGRSLRR